MIAERRSWMPRITVISQDGAKSRAVSVTTGETVLTGLRKLGILMESCCGSGACKKCTVFYESPMPEVCPEDAALGEAALLAGKRLACRHRVTEDIRVRLTGGMRFAEEERPQMQIEGFALQRMAADRKAVSEEEREYTVILDIGTTTLAAAFVRESDFGIEQVLTRENSERRYGSDVISRIQAANEGNSADMQIAIWADIEAMCAEFADQKYTAKGDSDKGSVCFRELVVTGNTVMEHLLCGYSLKGLGEAPFRPFSLELTRQKKSAVFSGKGLLEETEVIVLPGISAFVGADIAAGLYAVSMDREDGAALFADIGTNGELALGVNGTILATTTSAGPAFEGANIRDGVPGIEGAIQRANLLGGRLVVETIGKKPPVGICGSGVLDLASELYRGGILDRHGTFVDGAKSYTIAKRADGSEILFTQEDMRQLQMAKSAIRSGIELLLKEAGVSEDAVQTVWLAGGFGCRLNVHKAALLGLIPKKLEKRTKAAGNTALLGAYQFAKTCREHGRKEAEMRFKELIKRTKVLNLAEQPDFETYYLRNMDF